MIQGPLSRSIGEFFGSSDRGAFDIAPVIFQQRQD